MTIPDQLPEGASPGLPVEAPAGDLRPVARRRRQSWVLALAMGLMIAFVLRGSFTVGNGETEEQNTGGKQIVLNSPGGVVAAFVMFEWTAERGADESFELLVWDDAVGAPEAPLEHVKNLEPTHWTPEDSKIDGWREIRWRVDLYDSSGELVRSSPVQRAKLE